MYGKIQITGTVEVVTGMHIGGSSAFSAIGAVDSPVIRDARTNLPMLPGSSLKGKMRTLLAKKYSEPMTSSPDDDAECITGLFGSAKKNHVKASRLLFSDMVLANKEDLYGSGIQSLTEVKFENSINRLTAVANPRQIERVIRGSEFKLDLVYEIDPKCGNVMEQVEKDFELIREGFQLLEYDYIGGSGSRGYGKIKFKNLSAEEVVGDISEEIVAKCNELLAKN